MRILGWVLRKDGKIPIVLAVCDTGMVLMRDGRGWNPYGFTAPQNTDAAVIEAIKGWNEQGYSEGSPVTVEIPEVVTLGDGSDTIARKLSPLLKRLESV